MTTVQLPTIPKFGIQMFPLFRSPNVHHTSDREEVKCKQGVLERRKLRILRLNFYYTLKFE